LFSLIKTRFDSLWKQEYDCGFWSIVFSDNFEIGKKCVPETTIVVTHDCSPVLKNYLSLQLYSLFFVVVFF